MDPKISNFSSSKISSQNSVHEEWHTLDVISLKQEIEYCNVDELSEEKKSLIMDLKASRDDISNSVSSEVCIESPEILMQNDQKHRIQKKTVSNSTEKYQSIEAEGEANQKRHGICDKLFVNLRQEDLQQLQKQKHFNGKQCASCSSETKLKKIFERCVDKHSGKVLFKCLNCQFQSLHLKDIKGHISNIHQIDSEMVQCDQCSYQKMETQEKICGLCLKVCDNFKAVEGDMKDVLDVVLPKIDLGAIKELVVCTDCTEMLIKCSAFKTTCLNAYNCIVSFDNYRDDIKLNLRDVYLSKSENGTVVPEDQAICRFCMDPIRNCSAISFDIEEKSVLLEKMMEQCLPELDLSLIKKPVICAPCHSSLMNCFYFVTNCLLVREKIKKYCETQGIHSRGQIELRRLLEFTAKDVTSEVNGNSVHVPKEERQFWEESESADEKIIDNGRDIIKSEQVFCGDSENAAEGSENLDGIKIQETFCGENETYVKEENLFEVENHEFLESNENTKMETDQPDFIRFEEGLDLPLSEVTTINCKLYKCDLCPYQAKRKDYLKSHSLKHKDLSEVTVYKCDFCPYRAKKKAHILTHLLKHKDPSEVAIYTCGTCSYQSKYKGDLKKHLLVHKEMDSSKVTVYKCDNCPYQTKRKDCLKSHLLIHKDLSEVTMYTCDTCSYQSKYKVRLKMHLLIHMDSSEVTMHKCGSCSYQSKYKDDLKKHLLVHMNSSEVKMHKCDSCSYQSKYKSVLKKHLLSHKNLSEVTVYTCDTCSYQSKYKGDLKTHLMAHTEMDPSKATIVYKCDTCSYQSKYKSNLNRHLLGDKEENPSKVTVYKCDFCPFQTIRKNCLKSHLLIHKDLSKVTMYACDTCSYQSKYRVRLKMHLLKHVDSSEVTMSKCDPCSYQSKYKDDLKKHVLAHKNPSEVTVYTCDTCSFQSKYKGGLKTHLLAHKEMDPSKVTVYKCDTCSFQSKYKSNLNRHLLGHKEKDPSKVTMYTCNTCSYQSKYKSDVRKHVLAHKNPSQVIMYKCDSCSYQTRLKEYLTSHSLVHKDLSEVTVYKCDFCSYQTKYNGGLKSHLLIHKDLSEVTLYKCDVCSYQSKYKAGLKRHVLTHNPS